MSGRNKATLLTWLTIVALPALALAYSGWSALSFRPLTQSTGDALTDAFIEAELKQNLEPRADAGNFRFGEYTRLGFSDGQFAAWEPEFGDDPRFWMLQYYFSAHQLSDAEFESMQTYDAWKESLLDEAIARGAADGAVLHMKLRMRQREWLEEAGQLCALPQPKPKQDSRAYQRELRRIVDEKHGDEQAQLFAKFFELAPEEAQPHFMLASLKAVGGDYDAAIAEYALANRAPENSALLGYPYDWLMEELGRGNPSLDKALAGGLYMDSIGRLALPNFIRIKHAYKAAIAEAAERGDVAGMTELHRAACRFGRQEGASAIQAMVGVVLVGLVREGVQGSTKLQLSARQSQACADVVSKTQLIKAEFKKSSNATNSPALNGVQAFAQGSLTERAEDLLTGGQCLALRITLEFEKDGVRERTAVSGPITELLRELEAISYQE